MASKRMKKYRQEAESTQANSRLEQESSNMASKQMKNGSRMSRCAKRYCCIKQQSASF
jgi:hypothetical protein